MMCLVIPYNVIKKIKAPIGDENCIKLYRFFSFLSIKKIKAPIGDENLSRVYHISSCKTNIKKIKAPIGDENL